MNIHSLGEEIHWSFAIPKEQNKFNVYLLLKDDEIIYVGRSSKSVLSRIVQHQYRMDFTSVSAITCKNEQEAIEKESQIIAKISPVYNREITSRESTGFLSKADIRKIIHVDMRIIKNAARQFCIETTTVGVRCYFHPSIVEATKKYIDLLKRKPLSLHR